MCTTLEKQVGSYTKVIAPLHGKRLQKLCRDGTFLSMFCPELQKLLKHVYNLTRKGRPFIWEKNRTILLMKSNAGW